MKFTYFFLIPFIFLTSCSNFSTTINIEKKLPEKSDDEPIYIFISDINTEPDSAVYIGTFTTFMHLEKQLLWGIGPSDNDLFNSIDKQVKIAGGNLVIIDKPSENSSGKFFKGKIYLIKDFERTNYTEDSLKKIWQNRKPDKLEGIYETDLSDFGDRYSVYTVKYGILRLDSLNYLMVYIKGYNALPDVCHLNKVNKIWKEGDVYSYIEKTEKPSLFKTRRYEFNKYFDEHCMMKLENGNLRISFKHGSDLFRRIYPDSSDFEILKGSLTGFAISKNKILTCYHGLTEEKSKIFVKGINGNFDIKYSAIVEKFDKINDIAVIRLEDSTIFTNYVPFPVSEAAKSTAEEIFVLGYPISSFMGEEIKLTNGIISSTSGLAGDLNTYQISAAVQPGNSGSPLFDKSGNLIGIVTSKLNMAEQVGYALKYKHIKEFLIKNNYAIGENSENKYTDLSFADKVKALQNTIYLIEIIDTTPKVVKEYDTKINKTRRR